MTYQCVQCGQRFITPPQAEGVLLCSKCGYAYRYGPHYLRYDWERLLLGEFREKFLLSKVLNNNGLISYRFMQEGSLSLSRREDVFHFKGYISSFFSQGRVLDVGCGLLELPGYLDFERKEGFEFYGIDPIDDRSFRGVRITGCAEFMPFPDSFFDSVIFATTLDHLCSVERAVQETRRVLQKEGKVFVWMNDPWESFLTRLKNKEEHLWKRLRLRFGSNMDKLIPSPGCSVRVKDFFLFPNGLVLYVPKGAVDPFHVRVQRPKEMIRLFEKREFKLINMTVKNKNEIFLCFGKHNSDR